MVTADGLSSKPARPRALPTNDLDRLKVLAQHPTLKRVIEGEERFQLARVGLQLAHECGCLLQRLGRVGVARVVGESLGEAGTPARLRFKPLSEGVAVIAGALLALSTRVLM